MIRHVKPHAASAPSILAPLPALLMSCGEAARNNVNSSGPRRSSVKGNAVPYRERLKQSVASANDPSSVGVPSTAHNGSPSNGMASENASTSAR